MNPTRPTPFADVSESGTRYALNARLRETFASEGYLILTGVVSRSQLAKLSGSIIEQFERVKREGRLLSGGGTVSGQAQPHPDPTADARLHLGGQRQLSSRRL
ncbi:MAG: hypothetical protein ABW061_22930 [Polyangiaceae bacterium]